MSQPTDFDALLADWLADDGPSDVPARVAAGAIAQVRALAVADPGASARMGARHQRRRPFQLLAAAAALVVLALVAALMVGALRPTPAPLPTLVDGLPGNGLIVVSRHWDLVLIDPLTDEESAVPLEWEADMDAAPGFTPDGRWVTWWSHGYDDAVDRYRMSALDGEQQLREVVTGAPTMAVWSPKGDRVAVAMLEDDGGWRMAILDATLQELGRIPVQGGVADWRPDGGALLVRALGPSTPISLQVWPVPSGDPTTITPTVAVDDPSKPWPWSAAAWSPDGRQIGYQSATTPSTNGTWEHRVFVMTADGTNPRMVEWSPDARTERLVGWSADGAQLLVESTGEDHVELGLVPVDGAPGRLIARLDGPLWETVWSPDQQRIAAWQGETGEVRLIEVATGAQTTKDWGATGGLAWQAIPEAPTE